MPILTSVGTIQSLKNLRLEYVLRSTAAVRVNSIVVIKNMNMVLKSQTLLRST